MVINEKKFNTIIEGTYHDDWRNLHFKIAQLDIPNDVTILNDGVYEYRLYGKTEDFQNIQKTNEGFGGLEATLDFLAFCKGVVLPYKPGFSNVLERPRTVCTSDGRIFIDEGMITDKAYLEAISSILKTSREIFEGDDFNKLYQEFVES